MQGPSSLVLESPKCESVAWGTTPRVARAQASAQADRNTDGSCCRLPSAHLEQVTSRKLTKFGAGTTYDSQADFSRILSALGLG